MSLLPQQLPPQTVPFGETEHGDKVIIGQEFWLFLYNVWLNSIGQSAGIPPSALIELASADIDAVGADATVLRQPIANLERQVLDSPQVATSDLPDVYKALKLAQDTLLPDAPALAQPVAVLTPGASVWTYTAPTAGHAVIAGGTVSDISISRQGTVVATGLTAGIFPLCRRDSLLVTYSMAPTATFMPWSSQ